MCALKHGDRVEKSTRTRHDDRMRCAVPNRGSQRRSSAEIAGVCGGDHLSIVVSPMTSLWWSYLVIVNHATDFHQQSQSLLDRIIE